MYYCYCIKKGFLDHEMDYAKKIGVYLFYDSDTDSFVDSDAQVIDIADKLVFVRTGVYEARDLMTAVLKHKGRLLTDVDDSNEVLNWPNYLSTKRRATIYSGADIINNLDQIVQKYGYKSVFLKTKEKNYSQIVDVEVLCDKNSNLYRALQKHSDEDFIISDAVDIIKDKHGPFEYRVFVVNNRILNISRTNDYLLEQVPSKIIEKARKVVSKLQDKGFPGSYVVDLFCYTDSMGMEELDVLECNPIEASGTYLYNSVFLDDYDIEHKCPSASIPAEKRSYVDLSRLSYDAEYNGRVSVFYQLPGHFANTLSSIALTGSSEGLAYFHINGMDDIDFTKFSLKGGRAINCESDLRVPVLSADEVIQKLQEKTLKKLLDE